MVFTIEESEYSAKLDANIGAAPEAFSLAANVVPRELMNRLYSPWLEYGTASDGRMYYIHIVTREITDKKPQYLSCAVPMNSGLKNVDISVYLELVLNSTES